MAGPNPDSLQTGVSKRPSFSISNLLLVITIVAISIAWWMDHNREIPTEHDIPGPLVVSFKVRTSDSSTSGGTIRGVTGIDYQEENIVVHTEQGGTILPGHNLISFTWNTE